MAGVNIPPVKMVMTLGWLMKFGVLVPHYWGMGYIPKKEWKNYSMNNGL